jgi:hypothetical protein
MLRLVKIGVEGEGPCTDIMEDHGDDLRQILTHRPGAEAWLG